MADTPIPFTQTAMAQWAKEWVAKLDKQIVDDMIARGETSRLKIVRPQKQGKR